MGLSDDPLPRPMQAQHGAAVSRADLQRADRGVYLRSMRGTAFFLAVVFGAVPGALAGLWVEQHWQYIFMALGTVGLPLFLWWTGGRRARRYAQLDAEARDRRAAETRDRTERQIAEARARGDFDRWNKDA